MSFLRKNKKGFTLTEVLLVLGLAAIIIIIIFMSYPKVRASQQVEAESKNIAAMQAGARSLYSSTANYAGLTNEIAIKANIIPDNMLQNSDGSTILNAWKGDVTIKSDGNTHSGEDDSGFYIRYVRLMPEACSKLVTSVAGSFYEINVNGTTVKDSGGQLDIQKTTTACSITGSGNYVLFYSE